MKVFASIVTTGFLLVGAFIPAVGHAETGISTPKSSMLAVPIKVEATPLQSVNGIYLVQGAEWHSGCQSQLELVHQAADAMGMGKDWYYMQQIFSRESCVDPGRVNSIGAKGLGQSLGHADFTCGPGDIPCELIWFNSYAQRKGGWAASWADWQSKNWW